MNSTSGGGSRKRILLCIVGVIVGSVVGALANGSVLTLGMKVVPPPPGVDPNNPDSINTAIASYSLAQFMVPFAAHAVGAFVGGALAWIIARGDRARMVSALTVGVLFLAGGITMVLWLPNTPGWFSALDLTCAYLPMAWLGTRLARALTARR